MNCTQNMLGVFLDLRKMEHSTRFRRRQTGEDVIIGSIDTSKGSGFGVLRESGCNTFLHFLVACHCRRCRATIQEL